MDEKEKLNRVDADVDRDANPDPITGQPGAHPVGTGVGAAAAGVIGTALGALAGPVGGVVGAVAGSVVGGLVGKSTAEAFDPTVEEAYWRENYKSRPYAKSNLVYEDYQPAYRTGYEGFGRYRSHDKPYCDIEPDLQRDYEANRGTSRASWDDAKHAVQDAWERVRYSSMSHDQDEYWRQNYTSRPYYQQGITYDRYQPPYRMGYESYARYRGTGRTYEDVEPELRREYERDYGSSGLGWEQAKHAVRDAWDRVEHAFGKR